MFVKMSQPQASNSKALPITTLVVIRLLTLLLASLITFTTNNATFQDDLTYATVSLHECLLPPVKNLCLPLFFLSSSVFIFLYGRYMLSTIVIGLAYNILQIPFAIYHASLGKLLIDHDDFLQFEFYGDKVITSLLATGVGAAFGATSELRKNFDDLDIFFKQIGYTSLGELRSKLDNFFNMAFVSASLLLIGCFCSGVSSVISSLALSKRG